MEICINDVFLPTCFFIFPIHILIDFTRLINDSMCCDMTLFLGFHEYDFLLVVILRGFF